ncbi:uncharacterized protein LOC116339798 isoform X2 [Contarinia nasturtii]|uniref:uncharacterized protein LOC116339798 isoform X2 n=1 Tax=Contarinia nasturtii TaxID=265458 RepID=UPI0012D37BBD|nr:uncharacterized protein LOC116339798 isoform X2 [Contarinia nasturtii]
MHKVFSKKVISHDKCAQCGKIYANKKSLEEHIERMHKSVKCTECTLHFKNAETFRKHYNNTHANAPVKVAVVAVENSSSSFATQVKHVCTDPTIKTHDPSVTVKIQLCPNPNEDNDRKKNATEHGINHLREILKLREGLKAKDISIKEINEKHLSEEKKFSETLKVQTVLLAKSNEEKATLEKRANDLSNQLKVKSGKLVKVEQDASLFGRRFQEERDKRIHVEKQLNENTNYFTHQLEAKDNYINTLKSKIKHLERIAYKKMNAKQNNLPGRRFIGRLG